MSTENSIPVDPRVQIELEKLNSATDNINKFEVELDEAKSDFRKIQAESVGRMKLAAHKLGNSIEAAKPYYESRIYAAQLTKETQQAAVNYEKAKSIVAAAKEMVYLAEQGLGEKSTLDTACQEMLSHAASKVNQSQLEVTDARNFLKMCQLKLEVANNRVGKLQGQLKAAIRASRPYYETRANYNGLLKAQKMKITDLEAKIADAKLAYNEALKNLEMISEEIHRQRQANKNLLNFDNSSKAGENLESSNLHKGQFPCSINSTDEYLAIPDKLSVNSSPVRQRHPDKHDCPHLLQDFETVLTFTDHYGGTGVTTSNSMSMSDSLLGQVQLHGPYEVKTPNAAGGPSSNGDGASSSTSAGYDIDEIEQWTEIRLSHSDSTSSTYSNQSLLRDDCVNNLTEDTRSHRSNSSSSSDERRRKVTCTTIFHDEHLNQKQGLSQWLTRSNSFRASGSRRQSLDLLIDASDKVKDVFSLGFQRVGRSLERRNSESEVNGDGTITDSGKATAPIASSVTTTTAPTTSTSIAGEFFLFSRSSEPKELLSDEQVENLLLNHSVDENGTFIADDLTSLQFHSRGRDDMRRHEKRYQHQTTNTSIYF